MRTQPDLRKQFILINDASSYAISAILAQKYDKDREVMVYSYSKGLEKAQLNYSVRYKEVPCSLKISTWSEMEADLQYFCSASE